MTTTRIFSSVEFWTISDGMLRATFDELQKDGCCGREGIVFWAGSRKEGVGRITLAILVEGPGVTKEADFLHVSENAMAAIAELLDPPNLVLVGQMHTHCLGVAHSPTDNRHIFDSPGYLSVVVEHYAVDATTDPGTWGVHVGTGTGFVRMGAKESREKILVQEGQFHVKHVWA